MGLKNFRPSVRLSAETRANKKRAALQPVAKLLCARNITLGAWLLAVVGVGKSSGAYRGTILVDYRAIDGYIAPSNSD